MTLSIAPTPEDDRIPTLDILRGVAVMGIVLMNIVSFAMPDAAYFNPQAWGGTSAADIAAWALGLILVDGKMRGLFSLLFGASMVLVIDRADLNGRNGQHAHIARACWLFLFGLAHFLFLWRGDILMLYAIVSLIALPFAHRQPIDLAKAAFIAFTLHFLVMTALMAGFHAMPPATIAGAIGQPGAPEIAAQLTLFRSGFGAIVAAQIALLPDHALLLLYAGLDTLGFMLLGMAMLKVGFLTGRWDAAHYVRTARHCLLIGLPPMLALTLWAILSGYKTLTVFGIAIAWSFPFRIPLTVGYAALTILLIQRHPGYWMTTRTGAVGRMALSNYIVTSLLMALLFQGWGLGLFGHIDRALLYVVVPAIWMLLLLWSKPWLDRFAYGPIEWVWRSLARGRLQPMRRNARGG